MTGASHAAFSRSRFDRGQALRGVEIALDGEHSALPQHGNARQIERADMIERTGHQQPRIAAKA